MASLSRTSHEPPPVDDLLRWLLDRQTDVRPVHRFARAHDIGAAGDVGVGVRWRDRIPLTAPRPGEQYAFEVDLDACTACKACVTACHNLNGLAPGETWRAVGVVHGGSTAAPYTQTVTAACHHCLDPACMGGCPVDAYSKDPITGIVSHHDDQCIGCRYCTLTCPYEVPQYDATRGIVRKCDMCHQRLGAGEAPACVQACPSGAIKIATVRRDDVVADNEAGGFLPAAPDPGITQPTTIYRTKKIVPRNALPADYHDVRPSHGHGALVAMLVGTQAAVGAMVVGQLGRALAPRGAWASSAWLALAIAIVALGASLLHLGRPHLAHRAVRGLRHSWLSREIVAFGGFAGLAALTAFAEALGLGLPWLGVGAAVAGVGGVLASVMVYAATRKEVWRVDVVAVRFAGTTIVLGAGAALVLAVVTGAAPAVVRALAATVAIATALKLVLELALLLRVRDRRHGPFRRSATLLLGPFRALTTWRLLAGAIGGLALPALVVATPDATIRLVCAAIALAACLAAEAVERHLFFVAAAAPRMPGGAT